MNPFIRPRVWWGWFLVPIAWPMWCLCWVLIGGIKAMDMAFGDLLDRADDEHNKRGTK